MYFQVGIMECLGSLIPPIDTDVIRSTMLITWREWSKKEFNAWCMEAQIEEVIIQLKVNFPISGTTAVITLDFMVGGTLLFGGSPTLIADYCVPGRARTTCISFFLVHRTSPPITDCGLVRYKTQTICNLCRPWSTT